MFTYNKKTILSVFALLALAIVLVACSGPATADAAANPLVASGGITVVGQGEAFGQPDQAEVQVGVETFAPQVSQATHENEAAIQAIMDALTAQGIAAKDIQTTNYSLWAEQTYGDQGPEGIAGYRVNNQVNAVIPAVKIWYNNSLIFVKIQGEKRRHNEDKKAFISRWLI